MSQELEAKLIEVRQKMDEQNQKVISELLARLELAKEINHIKSQLGLPKEDRSREEVILLRVSQASKTREENAYLHTIFEEIFNSTKDYLK